MDSRLNKVLAWSKSHWGIFIALAGVIFTLASLHPSLLFSNTTTAGGDTGAHYIIPYFAKYHIFNHLQLTGWSNQWYGGYASLTFYFPLPSLIIALISYVLPYGLAFKIGTLLGSILLPFAVYAVGRASGKLSELYVSGIVVGSVMFLFDRSFTIDGGNLASTFAGEFSFSLSLAFGLFALAIVVSGLNSFKKMAGATLLLAAMALSHIIPAAYIGIFIVVYILFTYKEHNKIYFFAMAGLSLGLTATWSLPFLLQSGYTTSMGWEKVTDFRASLLPHSMLLVIGLGILGAVISIVRRWKVGIVFSIMSAGSALGFILIPNGALYNARFLPFWFLGIYLLAMYGIIGIVSVIGEFLFSKITEDNGRRIIIKPTNVAMNRISFTSAVVALVYFIGVSVAPLYTLPSFTGLSKVSPSFIRGWAQWNYSGYTAKPAWPEYSALMHDMTYIGSKYGCGRAMWEYNSNQNDFGTPEALMLLPYWTNNCIDSMEGLFFESSATTPYHFLNQSELSASPSEAMSGLPYSGTNLTLGVKHLAELGVKYYMAFTPSLVAAADINPNLKLVYTQKALGVGQPTSATMGDTWSIFLVKGSAEVAPLKYQPVSYNNTNPRDWLKISLPAYLHAQSDHVYVASGSSTWAKVPSGSLSYPETKLPKNTVSNIVITNSKISFHVSKVGVPVLVKMSYFPNWQSSTVSGIYRATPNEMVVVPTNNNVVLTYGMTPANIVGTFITYLCIIILIMWPLATRFNRSRKGSSEETLDDGALV